MKKIIVTGASGYVGKHTIPFLASKGYEITAIVRSEQAADKVRSFGATSIVCDITNLQSLRNALSGANAVVHMAARLDFWGNYKDFYEDNVLLTERLLEACKSTDIELFVYISAAAVAIGSKSAQPFDESAELPKKPQNPYIATKTIAENLVLSRNSSNFRCIALRPPLVWGNDALIFTAILEVSAKNQYLWIDKGKYPIATVHVDNLAAAIDCALKSNNVSGVFFISDGEMIEFRKLITTALTKHGIKPTDISLPIWAARGSALAGELLWKNLGLPGRPLITNILIDLIGGKFTINDSKARDILEYKNQISVTEGLLEL
jgi:nucleoside-diphosphate-sugar epimerase